MPWPKSSVTGPFGGTALPRQPAGIGKLDAPGFPSRQPSRSRSGLIAHMESTANADHSAYDFPYTTGIGLDKQGRGGEPRRGLHRSRVVRYLAGTRARRPGRGRPVHRSPGAPVASLIISCNFPVAPGLLTQDILEPHRATVQPPTGGVQITAWQRIIMRPGQHAGSWADKSQFGSASANNSRKKSLSSSSRRPCTCRELRPCRSAGIGV